MQSGIPSLPVVCSDKHSCSSSKYSDSINGTPRKSKSPYNSATHLLKRRSIHDTYGSNSSYRSSARFYPISQPGRPNKNPVSQRILSAKMLRVKQLQNQLTDAHYHLNELSNENKLLKAIQKKQESALKKYEGANAELPRIINSHHEELRILQLKYKKLKEQHKITCDTLKEKEKELHSLQVFNKRLLQLNQDRNLLDREKLQSQVTDLNYQIQQQQDTIQMLNKKLALETKSLKQQIHAEVVKHKETQKNLQESLEKLKSLEDLLDNREKRLYYNNQLPTFNKNRITGHLSFSSLEDSGVSLNYSKSSMKKNDSENEKILPSLSDLDMNFERKSNNKSAQDSNYSFTMSERKLRLSKSGSRSISAKSTDRMDKLINSNILKNPKDEESEILNSKEIDKLDLMNREDDEKFAKKNPMDDLDYTQFPELSDEIQSLNEEANLQHENLFKKSRKVVARLTAEDCLLESTESIIQSSNNYEEVENMIKKEFEMGQELGKNLIHDIDLNYAIQINEEETDDNIEDATLSLKKLHIESTEVKQNNEKKDKTDVKVNNDLMEKSEVEDMMSLEKTHFLEEDRNNSLRQSNGNTDLSDESNKLSLQDISVNETEKMEALDLNKTTENIETIFCSEDKSSARKGSTEKIRLINSETRRNSVEKEEKDEGLDKKENEKLPKVNFDKAKLIAELNAIDNNDNNIEFVDSKVRKNSGNKLRTQITENLYRGIPTQRRNDDIPNSFTNMKLQTKTRGNGITKFH